MTLLRAANIWKSYKGTPPVSVLRGASLEINSCESVAICGRSGEGKSTLLHILGNLEAPSEGELFFLERPFSSYSTPLFRNRHIGFIFQSFQLLEDYPVLENVLMPAKIGRQETKPGSFAHNRALQLLDEVGLSSKKEALAKILSGGEKQRVAIARALCNDPALILADEPSGNLDHATSLIIHEMLLKAVKQHGKTLIIVTHDTELASLCSRTLTLKEGVL